MAFAPARVAPAVAQCLQIPLQVPLYVGLFIFAQYLVNRWQIPLPANLVDMVILLLLIVCWVIPLSWVRTGTRWLLAEMLLFSAPAVVAVVNHTQLLMVDGWWILLVIVLNTLMVLGATAWVVDRVYRYEVSRLKNEWCRAERSVSGGDVGFLLRQ